MEYKEPHTNGALAAICTNLSKACDKQMRPTEAGLFDKLASYFSQSAGVAGPVSINDLDANIAADTESGYIAVESRAQQVGDRGALRCVTWGKKVTAIHKSVLVRYAKQGDALMEGSNLYVCEACGFIAIAKEVPGLCPICKAPASRFTKI
ncbi:MAG: rubredoxin [Spirochaetae bacterium HGW-Spirochaetae-4]|jgi:rubrerythrin|nr:MAG: hypothetical protein A2Y31_01780 [Spirochaetes bacterium GWC2_52_13]PKL22940.1 MAG: rubredoxin [Spirochaetae bacterium HGW-Spirochaetae-4]HCG63654.1 rubredoxin [Sphaerochaeta sp.]